MALHFAFLLHVSSLYTFCVILLNKCFYIRATGSLNSPKLCPLVYWCPANSFIYLICRTVLRFVSVFARNRTRTRVAIGATLILWKHDPIVELCYLQIESFDSISIGVSAHMSDIAFKQLEQSVSQKLVSQTAKREVKGQFGQIIADYKKKVEVLQRKNGGKYFFILKFSYDILCPLELLDYNAPLTLSTYRYFLPIAVF